MTSPSFVFQREIDPNSTAIVDESGSCSYAELHRISDSIAHNLMQAYLPKQPRTVCFLATPSHKYVALQWGIWKSGGIAVPLSPRHPVRALQYVMNDCQAAVLLTDEENHSIANTISDQQSPLLFKDLAIKSGKDRADVMPDDPAMILYTSGTTSKPKGVLSSHRNISYQINTLVDAWEWSKDDYILNILPLHHVHGIINVMSCALWSGSTCEFLPRFDPKQVWEKFGEGRVNLFMAVPTIYYKLIQAWEEMDEDKQQTCSQVARKFRLMVSGSAALPVSVLEKWKSITGHTLLERYGMTEIGMALSNPYRGERRPGFVGNPLPGVELRLVDPETGVEVEGQPGEIQVRGMGVFERYWNKPEQTRLAFTKKGWFRTGDIAQLIDGAYKILGRDSVDILKSGGYKISALEIEDVLRGHPLIKDCAVVGIPDEEWGEVIGASLIVPDQSPTPDDLREWLKERIPVYKVPRYFIFQKDFPRNAMGKVTKNELRKLFEINKG